MIANDGADSRKSSSKPLSRTTAYRSFAGSMNVPAIIACSGGTDSSALVVLAAEARRRARSAPFVVVHVDHRSRPGSGDEADVVRILCRDIGVSFVPAVVDEAGAVRGHSLEDVWRERRYAALAAVARRLGIGAIATAHTRDDQVETVLMRMMSGSSKLTIQREITADVHGTTLKIIRPLLDTSRSELEEVLRLAGITPVHDPSNDDRTYRRNAVRHELIPQVSKVFPGFDTALLRSARLHESDADYCDLVAEAAFASLASKSGNDCLDIERGRLLAAHPAIATRVILLAARSLIETSDDRELSFERVHSVLAAASGRSGALIELPYGVRVDILRETLRFRNATKGTACG